MQLSSLLDPKCFFSSKRSIFSQIPPTRSKIRDMLLLLLLLLLLLDHANRIWYAWQASFKEEGRLIKDVEKTVIQAIVVIDASCSGQRWLLVMLVLVLVLELLLLLLVVVVVMELLLLLLLLVLLLELMLLVLLLVL